MKHKCLTPNRAWLCGVIRCKSDGILSPHMVFSETEALRYYTNIYGSAIALKFIDEKAISVPCGKCLACQIRKRKDWTTRLSHEAYLYDDNCCFVTLTYNDDNLPVTCFRSMRCENKILDRGLGELPLPTLVVSDVQKFIKRLRRHLEYVPKRKDDKRDHVETPIRYFCVGEYGGKTGRPHYHLLIFGWKPSDMVAHSTRNGRIIYRSAQIEKLWHYGFSTVQPVGGGCARYCSRYVTKKFARLTNDDPFKDSVLPEFTLKSVREGGIGAKWFDENYESICANGFCTVKVGGNYIKASIPTYYLRRCRNKFPQLWLQLRDERLQFASSHVLKDGFDELVRTCDKYVADEVRLMQSEFF